MLNPYESPQLDPLGEIPISNLPNGEQFCALHGALFVMALAIVGGTEAWRYDLTFLTNYVAICRIGLAAFGVASLLLAAYRRCTGGITFPVHFGHWLLLCDGVAWIADQPLQSRFYLNYTPSSSDPELWELNPHPEDWILVLRSFFHIINWAMFIYAVRHCAHERNWRWYAWARIAYISWCILQTLFFSTGFLLLFAGLVSAVVIVQTVGFVISVVQDIRQRAHRDYLHWLGVGVEGYLYLQMNVRYSGQLLQTAAAPWV